MSDIFISYSRRDSPHALALTERLRGDGMGVWIDLHGIEAATSWSKEIVQAIKECKVFCLLISEASLASHNVVKEVSIASELRRPILPLDVGENVMLNDDFLYQLAGLQRVAVDNYEAIFRALKKFGLEIRQPGNEPLRYTPPVVVVPEPVPQVAVAPAAPADSRKSLIVLPFEDQSPMQDNGWFADGLMSELIQALSNIKSLRLIDEKTSREFKGFAGKTSDIARELDVRYFLQGSVRKFGEQVKISMSLLDFVAGEHLWNDSHKGPFSDIFDIQEAVAMKVVEGFKLNLTNEEKQKIEEKETRNPEAYELYLKSQEYFNKQTKESLENALVLAGEAILLDPEFAEAAQHKSGILCGLYRAYSRKPEYLEEAKALALKAQQLKPTLWATYDTLSKVYRWQGKLLQAEAAVLEWVEKAPESYHSHFALGFFYSETNQPAKAIPHYEAAIKLKSDNLARYWNLVIDCDRAGEKEKMVYWAREALPHYSRRLRLAPDDEPARVNFASLLGYAGEIEEARLALQPILAKQSLDGFSLYNIACLQVKLLDFDGAIHSLTRARDIGFASMDVIRSDTDLDPLRGMPEFEKLVEGLG